MSRQRKKEPSLFVPLITAFSLRRKKAHSTLIRHTWQPLADLIYAARHFRLQLP